MYAHVPWPDKTLPWVTIAFHGPAFSEVNKELAAVDALVDLNFGQTSEVYKRLVEQEQKVDQLIPYVAPTQDPSLVTVLARVKRMEDVLSVRDELVQGCSRCNRYTSTGAAPGRCQIQRPVRTGAVSG